VFLSVDFNLFYLDCMCFYSLSKTILLQLLVI